MPIIKFLSYFALLNHIYSYQLIRPNANIRKNSVSFTKLHSTELKFEEIAGRWKLIKYNGMTL